MRVLVLHSRYASGSISGENRVVEDEVRLLREAGHEVRAWTPFAGDLAGLELAATGGRAVWSRQAVSKVRELVRVFAPDVVHFHNLFPLLSPAAVRATAEEARVVVTLHNYRLLCLPATFLRNGTACERCLGRLPWRGVRHRCYRGSRGASSALAASLALHRAIGTFERVALFLAVSRLVRDKHVEGGIAPQRIRVKPNFVWPYQRREGAGDYFLFAGRLSPERDVGPLLSAWSDVPARLVVAGEGPESEPLRALAPPNVSFRGPVAVEDMPSLFARARALVFPTRAREGCPRAILEAFAAGVPILASDVGSVPELVEHGVTGLLLPSLARVDVADAVERLLDDRAAERLGEAAWRRWRDRHSPERGLAELEAAYEAVGAQALA